MPLMVPPLDPDPTVVAAAFSDAIDWARVAIGTWEAGAYEVGVHRNRPAVVMYWPFWSTMTTGCTAMPGCTWTTAFGGALAVTMPDTAAISASLQACELAGGID